MAIMTIQVTQLYPQPGGQQPLQGLYLAHGLHELGSAEKPFIYGNFISSLDGRIAVADGEDGEPYIPTSLANPNDWILFQELQAQADCFITHGGYLRSLAAGKLDNALQVGLGEDDAHLLEWRKQNGMQKQPGVVVLSASLNFPIPPSVREHKQAFHIVTTEGVDRTKVKIWRDKGFDIIMAGRGKYVEGEPLIGVLKELGFRSAYLEAGPILLANIMRASLLDRLYLTMPHHIVGGEHFHTMLTGGQLGQAGRLSLRSLYLDSGTDEQAGQFFACFDPKDK